MAAITTARVRSWFETFGIDLEAHAILNGDDSVDAMLQRIAGSINSGERTTDQFVQSLIRASGDGGVTGMLNLITKRGLTVNDVLLNSGIEGITAVTSTGLAEWLAGELLAGTIGAVELQGVLDTVEPVGAITVDPAEDEIPPVEEIDPAETEPALTLEEQTQLLFPFLPDELVQIYVDAWAQNDNPDVALAVMRQSDAYDQYFAGNRRDDGTVRLSEGEYIQTLEGYSIELLGYGLNPTVFEDQLINSIIGGVSVSELGARLDLAFEQVLGINLDEVKQFYALDQGIEMTDEAIFASIIDPTIADSIIRQEIAVAQVGSAGLLAGFSFGETEGVAERLAGVGFGLQQALGFFGEAADQTVLLTALGRRFSDGAEFTLEDFAGAEVFADAFQRRRAQRLRDRDRAQFRAPSTQIATDTEGALTGLVAR